MSGPASRVSRVLMSGPLAPFADAYAAELRERGYTSRSMVGQLRQVGRLSCWLEARGLGAGDLTGERIEGFLVWQRGVGRHRCQWSRPGLIVLLEVLDGLGLLAPEMPAPGSPIDLLLSSFERYLVSERGLAPGTIVGYLAHARWFWDELGSAGLAELSAGAVTSAVLRKAASGVSSARSRTSCPGCGGFCGSAFSSGWSRRTSRRRRWWSVVGGLRCCRVGSAWPTRMLCWTPVIAAGRSGGGITH